MPCHCIVDRVAEAAVAEIQFASPSSHGGDNFVCAEKAVCGTRDPRGAAIALIADAGRNTIGLENTTDKIVGGLA